MAVNNLVTASTRRNGLRRLLSGTGHSLYAAIWLHTVLDWNIKVVTDSIQYILVALAGINYAPKLSPTMATLIFFIKTSSPYSFFNKYTITFRCGTVE